MPGRSSRLGRWLTCPRAGCRVRRKADRPVAETHRAMIPGWGRVPGGRKTASSAASSSGYGVRGVRGTGARRRRAGAYQRTSPTRMSAPSPRSSRWGRSSGQGVERWMSRPGASACRSSRLSRIRITPARRAQAEAEALFRRHSPNARNRLRVGWITRSGSGALHWQTDCQWHPMSAGFFDAVPDS